MKRYHQKNILPYVLWLLVSSLLLGACGQLQTELPNVLPPSRPANDLAISSINLSLGSAQSASQKDSKVSLCHQTGSQGTPYVFITVSQKGGISGHSNHPGDIFNVSSPGDCTQIGAPSGPTGPQTPIPTETTPQPVTPIPTATTPPPATPNPTATPSPTAQYKPTNICHATGDPSQPYEFIAISDDATYILHLNHTGDIFDVNSPADCPTTAQTILADEPVGTPPPKKVAICHATGSESNPYVFVFVKNNDSLNGHKGHEYDIFDVTQSEDCPTSIAVETQASPDN